VYTYADRVHGEHQATKVLSVLLGKGELEELCVGHNGSIGPAAFAGKILKG